MEVNKMFQGLSTIGISNLFELDTVVLEDILLKLKKGRVPTYGYTDLRQNFFNERVVNIWTVLLIVCSVTKFEQFQVQG